MASLNKIQLIGHLGQDVEMRFMPDGTPVATFSVATSEHWTDKGGEKREKTEWHRVEAWARLGEIMQQFTKKGSQVYIEGSLHTEKYTDQAGIERYSTKVRAQSIQLLDRRPAGQGGNSNQGGDQDRDQGGDQDRDQGGYAAQGAGNGNASAPAATAAAGQAPVRRGFKARTPVAAG